MLVSLFLLFLLAAAGLSLTYLFAEDETLLWRLCAGEVVGSAIFSLVCFLAACLFGLNAPVILLSLLATMLPMLLFILPKYRAEWLTTWRRTRSNLNGADINKILSFAYYLAIVVVLWWFFDRAMFANQDGIFTGSSHNLGDLPFHLGAIFSFADGQNFPPENPSYAFAKFTYPFMTDFIAATFARLGASARGAIYVQDVFLAFSIVVLFEKFAAKFTGSRLAGRIAPLLLLLSGGLGFVIFFHDFGQQAKGFWEFLNNLPADYTINDHGIRWGNTLTTLLLTQRSLLLGMPLTILVLQKLWEIFSSEDTFEIFGDERDLQNKPEIFVRGFRLSMFLVGLLAGCLPLIHMHSLAALFVVTAFLFFFRLDKWRDWVAFGVGVSLIAIPELLWAMTGSATRLSEFFAWHFGWDKRDADFFVFWGKNLGLFIPLLFAGLYFVFAQHRKEQNAVEQTAQAENNADAPMIVESEKSSHLPISTKRLLYYLPFTLLFIVPNLMKLAPWEWDNYKVLIYWFVGSVPFVALVLAMLWQKNLILKLAAAACFLVLTFSGAIDVWRVVSRQINYNDFSKDSVAIAEQIKEKTEPNALFLNAPTYNSTVVLTGRRSLMRYDGHLASYGIDYGPREDDVKKIYAGAPDADALLQKYDIEYVVVSPEELGNLPVNEDYFKKFPVLAEVGQYRVYQIKK